MPVLGLTQRMSLLASTDNQWTPAVLSPANWYDAADTSTVSIRMGGIRPDASIGGGPFTAWFDKSGNSRNATYNSFGGFNPIILTDGVNLKVVRCSSLGSHHALYFSTDHIQSNSWCLCSVFWRKTTGGHSLFNSISPGPLRYWGFWNGVWNMNDTYTAPATTYVAGRADIVFFESNASTPQVLLRINGGASSNTYNTSTAIGASPLSIGVASGNGQNIDTGEVLLFNRTLSLSEKQQIEGYFAHKWAATGALPNGHPYKTSPPVF